MYWGYFHLATVLALLWYCQRSPVHLHASLCLLVWFTLRNMGYEYGQIESESVYQTMAAYLILCTIGYARHQSALFAALAGIGGTVCVYNELHAHDAYMFKTVLGGLFQVGVVTVFFHAARARN